MMKPHGPLLAKQSEVPKVLKTISKKEHSIKIDADHSLYFASVKILRSYFVAACSRRQRTSTLNRSAAYKAIRLHPRRTNENTMLGNKDYRSISSLGSQPIKRCVNITLGMAGH
jgi:hypothetical protein